MAKFDNYHIKVDANLSKVTGIKCGCEVTPPEMNKALWAYLRVNRLVPEKKQKAVVTA